MNNDQLQKIQSAKGFIAALDQSGGSTPKALGDYGVTADQYTGETEMFDRIHEMRSRIMTSPAFNGDRILGAILFENTMDRQVEGRPSADYLWSVKQVVPFLKVDKGMEDEANGVQMMKPMPALGDLLKRAVAAGVFGTKMRSVIKLANPEGIEAVVRQQFEIGHQILAAGLVPIIEPEVDIHSPQKAQAEELLRTALAAHLDKLDPAQKVMLKLSLPEGDNFYEQFTKHPRVLRVVALSGGYPREEANARLARNRGVVASFSRVLIAGLNVKQSDADFNTELDHTIQSIYDASVKT